MGFPDPLDESLPVTPERRRRLARMIRRTRRTIATLEQLIRDAEFWMAANPAQAQKIDIESDRVCLARLRSWLVQYERIWNRP